MGEQEHNHQQQKGGGEKEWLDFINSLRSKAPVKMYRLSISHYMRFIKANNISSLLKQDNNTKEQQIISYLVDMRRNQNLSYASLSIKLAALKNSMK